MKKTFLLLTIMGFMFSCSNEKKQNYETEDVSQKQIEKIEQYTQNLEEVSYSVEEEMDTVQNEIDKLLNEI